MAKSIYKARLCWGRWKFRAGHAAHSSEPHGLLPVCRLCAREHLNFPQDLGSALSRRSTQVSGATGHRWLSVLYWFP